MSYKYVARVRRNTATKDNVPDYEDMWFVFESNVSPAAHYAGLPTKEEYHPGLLRAMWTAFHTQSSIVVGTVEWGEHMPVLVMIEPVGSWDASSVFCCEQCQQETPREAGIEYNAGFAKSLTFCTLHCRDKWRKVHEV